MKNLVLLVTIALFSSVSLANITSDEAFLLNRGLGEVGNRTQVGTLLNKTANTLVAKYSYAVQGGSTAADISLLMDLGDSSSYAYLPDNAIIRNVFMEVLTQPVSAGQDTIAIRIDGAADLFPVTSGHMLGSYSIRAGTPVAGTTTTYIKLAATSIVKMRLGQALNGHLTAGKFNVIIDYIIGD